MASSNRGTPKKWERERERVGEGSGGINDING